MPATARYKSRPIAPGSVRRRDPPPPTPQFRRPLTRTRPRPQDTAPTAPMPHRVIFTSDPQGLMPVPLSTPCAQLKVQLLGGGRRSARSARLAISRRHSGQSTPSSRPVQRYGGSGSALSMGAPQRHIQGATGCSRCTLPTSSWSQALRARAMGTPCASVAVPATGLNLALGLRGSKARPAPRAPQGRKTCRGLFRALLYDAPARRSSTIWACRSRHPAGSHLVQIRRIP